MGEYNILSLVCESKTATDGSEFEHIIVYFFGYTVAVWLVTWWNGSNKINHMIYLILNDCEFNERPQ